MMTGVWKRSRILRVRVSPSMPGNIRSTSRMSNFCCPSSDSACVPSGAIVASTPCWPRNSTTRAASLRSSSMTRARVTAAGEYPLAAAASPISSMTIARSREGVVSARLGGERLQLRRRQQVGHLRDVRHDVFGYLLGLGRMLIGEVVELVGVELVRGERGDDLVFVR